MWSGSETTGQEWSLNLTEKGCFMRLRTDYASESWQQQASVEATSDL